MHLLEKRLKHIEHVKRKTKRHYLNARKRERNIINFNAFLVYPAQLHVKKLHVIRKKKLSMLKKNLPEIYIYYGKTAVAVVMAKTHHLRTTDSI